MSVSVCEYGNLSDGRAVKEYRLCGGDVQLHLIEYGAIINKLLVKDKHGETRDIVLGFDNIHEYETKNSRYFGAIVGRCANR